MESKSFISRTVEQYAFDERLTGRHMVFLAGPRQVGKTMLAQRWLEKKRCRPLYFNWDDISTRKAYLSDGRFFESSARSLGVRDPWIVFDEIHKRNNWRDILKGVYDVFRDEFRFLITGSARLDLFRRSGDSLVGRYNLFHMMPLNIREITHRQLLSCFLQEAESNKLQKAFEGEVSNSLPLEVAEAWANLWRHGPFPEPFLKQSDRFSRKWHQDYFSLVLRQDLRDTSRVIEIDKIENLLLLIPSRVASPLSMANLARELEVAHTTAKSWLEQLKRLYLLFPVSPWTKKISRGLKKENKWYFLDWYYVPEGLARLENAVAAYLFRACLALTDMGYGNFTLHYIRTLERKEIDFVVASDNQPILTVEVKSADTRLSKTLLNRDSWFHNTRTLGIQVVDKKGVLQKYSDHTWVIGIERFLSLLI